MKDEKHNILYRHVLQHQEKALLNIRNDILDVANASSYNQQGLMDAADDIDECIAEIKSIRETI